MAVYVDHGRTFGENKSAPASSPHLRRQGVTRCRMIADTSAELHRMATLLAIPRVYCKGTGTALEHYDLFPKQAEDAVSLGARRVKSQWLVNALRRRARKEGRTMTRTDLARLRA